MRIVRFYCESIEPSCILDPIESNHASRVLRLPVGAPVEVFDGKGTLAEGTIEQIARAKVIIKTTHIKHATPCAHPKIILAVSFAKGQRFGRRKQHSQAGAGAGRPTLGRDAAAAQFRRVHRAAAPEGEPAHLH